MVTEGPDDIVGLLAYALLKQNIREEAARGIRTEGSFRDPTAVTVNLYRSSAEQRLGSFAGSAIDEARPEIQESVILSTIRGLESDLVSHINSRTGTLTAIWTNLVAWMMTGFLTAVVILLLAVTGAGDRLVEKISDALGNAAVSADEGKSTPPVPASPPAGDKTKD
ncbi:hypothetical protein LJR228_003398 [Mesorhizobium caraganae]